MRVALGTAIIISSVMEVSSPGFFLRLQGILYFVSNKKGKRTHKILGRDCFWDHRYQRKCPQDQQTGLFRPSWGSSALITNTLQNSHLYVKRNKGNEKVCQTQVVYSGLYTTIDPILLLLLILYFAFPDIPLKVEKMRKNNRRSSNIVRFKNITSVIPSFRNIERLISKRYHFWTF